jgi:hypothetical protein
MRAAVVETFEAELPARVRQSALRLPPGFNPRSRQLAQEWRADADSDQAYIERVLDWFNREFSYTLAAPPLGRHTGDEFLFDTREGYCEHFSSAFTILMRQAGIPARVVTGYVGGYRNPIGDYWLIQQSDAHAWVEVWLPGRGWLRLDPTAAVDPSRIFERYGQDRGAGAMGQMLGGTFAPLGNALDWLREGWNQMLLGFNAARQQALLKPFGIDEASRVQLLIAFAVSAALAIGFALWFMARQRSPSGTEPLVAAWHKLCRRLARAGLAKHPWETASAFSARVSPSLRDDDAKQLTLLSQRFVSLRYAEPTTNGDDPSQLIRMLNAFRPLHR